jgi:starch synthase
MNVLFLASEAYPFAKTGGLADVVAALPPALERQGCRVSLIIPAHRSTWHTGPTPIDTGLRPLVPVHGESKEGKVFETRLPRCGVPVYLIDRPEYFDRPGLYSEWGHDYGDNAARFVFFQRAALETSRLLGLRPDIVHCHDWQTGLVPIYLNEVYRAWPGSGLRPTGTMLTVHNLAYQGSFEPYEFAQTGLDSRLFTSGLLEAYGRLNFLKSGLVTADLIGTVSPTYAREIQTPEGGWGLDGILRSRTTDLRGIVNGIDRTEWDPATDANLIMRYDASSFIAGKAACKAELRRVSGLSAAEPDLPLLAYIGRLDSQKGIDLLLGVADNLPATRAQLIVLGTGEPGFEHALRSLEARHPDQIRCCITFSERLAHQIDGGADLLLMPSRYEPCGLSQLYGLAYGAIPVVRRTGGLADTVVDATPEAIANGTATGFAFRDPDAQGLRWAIDRALTQRADRLNWNRIIQTGMRADWSWDRSAQAYLNCYEMIIREKNLRAAG